MKITGRMFLLLHDLKKVKYTQTMEIRVFQNAIEMSGYLCRAYDLTKARYMDPGKEIGSYLIDGDALKEFILILRRERMKITIRHKKDSPEYGVPYGGMWIEVRRTKTKKGGKAGLVFTDGAGIEFPFLAVQNEVAAPAVAEFERFFRQS